MLWCLIICEHVWRWSVRRMILWSVWFLCRSSTRVLSWYLHRIVIYIVPTTHIIWGPLVSDDFKELYCPRAKATHMKIWTPTMVTCSRARHLSKTEHSPNKSCNLGNSWPYLDPTVRELNLRPSQVQWCDWRLKACNVKATSPKVALLLEAPFLDDSYSCSTFKHMLEWK